MLGRLTPLADRYGIWLLCLWLAWLAASMVGRWHADIAGLYIAARFYHEGQFGLIYPELKSLVSDMPHAWLPIMREIGQVDDKSYPFIYPPLWAALAAPIAGRTSALAFIDIAAIAQLLLYAGMVWLSFRLYAVANHRAPEKVMPFPRWAALSTVSAAYSVPVFFALNLGQPQVTVTFLIVASVFALTRDAPRVAGALMGLAAAIKLTPLAFIVLFLALRKWSAAATMLATTLALAALSFWICGPELNWQFAERAREIGSHVYGSRLNYNLSSILMSMVPGEALYDIGKGGFVWRAPAWLSGIASLSLLLALAGVWYLSRALNAADRPLALLVALSIAAAFFGPIGWAHYYMIPILFLPVLYAPPATQGARLIFALSVLLLSVGFVMSVPVFAALVVPAVMFGILAWWFLRVWPNRVV